jgi:hypothetical protein
MVRAMLNRDRPVSAPIIRRIARGADSTIMCRRAASHFCRLSQNTKASG